MTVRRWKMNNGVLYSMWAEEEEGLSLLHTVSVNWLIPVMLINNMNWLESASYKMGRTIRWILVLNTLVELEYGTIECFLFC